MIEKITAGLVGGAFLFGGLSVFAPLAASATGTPAGTAITNTASINYTDGNGNPFTANSNTVTTTVQNVPLVTVVASAIGFVVPGGQYNATYTITNTGNGNGNLNVSFPGDTGTDASLATAAAYEVIFPSTATLGAIPADCTLVATKSYVCTSVDVSTLIANAVMPENAALSLILPINVGNTATIASPAVTTPVAATVTYTVANNVGTTGAVTSVSSSGSQIENVVADSVLDLQKSVLEPGAAGNPSTTNLQYTVNASNGGYFPAVDLPAVKTLLGSSVGGVLITDAVPTFASSPLAVQSVTASVTSYSAITGAAATIYSTTNATGASGWTLASSGTALPAGTTFVGVLVSGGTGGTELAGDQGATTEGVVPTAKASVVITMQMTPPTGAGSGNANAFVNEANSVIGGNQPNPAPITGVTNPPLNVNGPNIAISTASSVSAIDSGTQGILYPTQAAGFTPTTVLQNGTSNAVGANALNLSAVFDGPLLTPEATGSYNGAVAVNNLDDFTAVAYLPTGFVPTNTSATAVVGNAVGATSTVTVPNTIQNTGNQVDTLTVSITAPTGWGVQIYNATSAGVITGSVLAGTPTTNTATYAFAAVPSGLAAATANTVNYAVTYTLPASATAFSVYDIVNTVTSTNDASNSNTTHDALIPGGPIALVKTQTLDATTCPTGVAIPGCIITYNVKYVNNAEAATYCPGTAPTTVPAFAGGYFAKGLTITENGATGGNTWGTTYSTPVGSTTKNTTGLNAAATDTVISTTTFPTGNTVGSYLFTALAGGSSTYILAPGCTGNIKFAVTINPN